MAKGRTARSIDEYIAACDPGVQPILKKLRATIRRAAPKNAEEIISYRIPALKLHGMLVYFAAFKKHIGLFPPVRGDAKLEAAVKKYAGPKGNLRFAVDEPIPYALIARIVRFRARQNLAKRDLKKKKR